ncbi:type I restriction endonuclease [Cyanobium sp. LEGE 06143]|uniref:type I restriction endonuclease n=1 Tax=Cyanobium sp. LEGE 06143 TaxID=945727 RepID=UPI00351C8D32
MTIFTESVVEEAALGWLAELGYECRYGPELASGQPSAERSDPNCRDVLLEGRLRSALARLNPSLPSEAIEDAYRKLIRLDAPTLIEKNRAAHRFLVDGIPMEFRRPDRWLNRWRPSPPDRLRRSQGQRLAGGQPVHRGGGSAPAPA